MTHTWTKQPSPSTAPTQLVVNGGFTTASGWSVFDGSSGAGSFQPLPLNGWSYGVNKAVYVPTAPFGFNLVQDLGLQLSTQYQVTFTIVVNAGQLDVALGDASIGTYTTSQTVTGTYTSGDGTSNPAITGFFHCGGDSLFNGSITNISIVGPGNFNWTPIASPIQPVWNEISKPTKSWTSIAKPSDTTTVSYGAAYGLLMAITQPHTVVTDTWTRMTKSTTPPWTEITKAT